MSFLSLSLAFSFCETSLRRQISAITSAAAAALQAAHSAAAAAAATAAEPCSPIH